MSTAPTVIAPEWRLVRIAPDRLEKLPQHLPRPVQKVLCQLGIESAQDVETFLYPSLESWTRLDGFPSLDRGVECLDAILQKGSKVCVHGDFDTDGLCATAVLTLGLQALGFEAYGHIPSREHGHGISPASLEVALQGGADTVISVDCGISSFEAAEYCRGRGVKLIVTDHHLPDDTLPDVEAIVNPQLDAEGREFCSLCGAGVALKMLFSLSQRQPSHRTSRPAYKAVVGNAVVLAAIATIADVMTLTQHNRSLVSQALKMLDGVTLPGLKVLIDRISVKNGLRAEDLAFQLIPRLNAAQRLDQGHLLWKLILADAEQAQSICEELDELNQRRRSLQKRFSVLASDRCAQGQHMVSAKGTEWPERFCGLIANHLLNHHHKPAVVFHEGDALLHASCRAPKGYHLKNALDRCSDLLEGYGGHAQAAGFRVLPERADALLEELDNAFHQQAREGADHPKLMIIDQLQWPEINEALLESLTQLEPFGEGNPRPVFGTRGLLFDGNPRPIGADRSHVALKLFKEGHPSLDAVGFGMAQEVLALDSCGRVDVAYTIGRSPYTNRLQLNLEAIRPHSTPTLP